jgi:hypothetical protein
MTNPINMDDFVRQVQSAATGGVIHAEGTLVGKTPTRPADEVLFDVCGRKRSPATLRHFRLGMKPPNYGKRYPATPPTEEEVLAVLGACQRNPNGRRCYALTVLLWRSGLRVSSTPATPSWRRCSRQSSMGSPTSSSRRHTTNTTRKSSP